MEDTKIGTVIHTLVALDPDVNTSEALNFAATEPITAVDKYGNEVSNNETFKDFFLVDKNSGKVLVANQLQRDIAAIVRITVLVTDITAPTVQQGQGMFSFISISKIPLQLTNILVKYRVDKVCLFSFIQEFVKIAM